MKNIKEFNYGVIMLFSPLEKLANIEWLEKKKNKTTTKKPPQTQPQPSPKQTEHS